VPLQPSETSPHRPSQVPGVQQPPVPRQTWLESQVLSQVPQFSGSSIVVHASPQQIMPEPQQTPGPGQHDDASQHSTPPQHVCPAAQHTEPQQVCPVSQHSPPPQQRPVAQQIEPQHDCPVGQQPKPAEKHGSAHAPSQQICPVGQACPHVPQCFASVWRSAQVPAQHVCPEPHEPQWSVPPQPSGWLPHWPG
jgi:hypothetical protein